MLEGSTPNTPNGAWVDTQLAFQGLVASVCPNSLAATAAEAKEGVESAQMQVVAAMVRTAFSCPDGITPLYDTLAALWLASGDVPEQSGDCPCAPLDGSFWDEFWRAVEQGAREPYTPATATARIATVSRATDPEFLTLAERLAEARFGPVAGLGETLDPVLDPSAWMSCPEGSLGAAMRVLVEGNKYDPDIGSKRELRALPPTMRRLHTHADCLDGVWHAVAGYDSTDSHLIAFAAFQMAQIGHLFSAAALALFAALAHFVIPNSFHILIHLIVEGWRHGRQAPPLVKIAWQHHWDQPVAAIRHRFEIPVYKSVFSKNLFRSLPGFVTAPT